MTEQTPVDFPVSVKVAAAVIDGIHTDVAALGFSNCVVVLVTQLASIGSIIQAVASHMSAANSGGTYDDPDLAIHQLEASTDVPVDIKFLLGNASSTAAGSIYQVLAMQIAQEKHRQNPVDERPLIVGIGLKLQSSSPVLAMANLTSRCRVW
ncbi:hypothetical protein GGI12_001433 [Dipsacomyces acuminosporus]|nr:hypothetical protein GGI12_001433 [Dipsacomyces acuminosporus]